jgi:23S rRNA pseudouridine1911/1915/1917 synthase
LKSIIEDKYDGYHLKDFLRVHYRLSGTFIKRLKYSGNLEVDHNRVMANHILKTGDMVAIDLYIPDSRGNVIPVEADIDILFEDEHIICLNKPAGICTHPVRFYTDNTLANHLMYYFISNDQLLKIRPVSRLDKGTSGLITFAKNEYAQDILSKSRMTKEYIAIAHGIFAEKRGIIDEPIEKNSTIEREINENGRSATTLYEVISESERYTLLKIIILTGRTHQIRVHFSHIGHPLLGDTLYSGYDDSDIISRQSLHSHRLNCSHPVYKYKLDIKAPIPFDFHDALKRCGLAYQRS